MGAGKREKITPIGRVDVASSIEAQIGLSNAARHVSETKYASDVAKQGKKMAAH